MSGMNFPSQGPSRGDTAEIQTIRQLHHHFFELILRRLEKTWPSRPEFETLGIGFFAADRDAFSTMAEGITPHLKQLGCETMSVDARCWKTRNHLRIMLCGWLQREDYRERLSGFAAGVRGWVPKAKLFGPDGSLVFFEHLGIAFSEPLTVDLFDHLPDRLDYGHPLLRKGSEDWRFDYSARTVDLSGLCYTRCRWGIDEQKGLVLEREPGTCQEGYHDALIQAAAPMMYETLRDLAKESPSAHPLVLAALSTVEDPEWEAVVQEELRSGISGSAETAMRIACGHGITRMDWRAFVRDYLGDEAMPLGPMEPQAYRWLLSGYVEGTYVTGEAVFSDQVHIHIRVLHPYRDLSMGLEPQFHAREAFEFLSLPDRLATESILAGLFLLGRWIDRNWSMLQSSYERYRTRLQELRTPPFHEPKALDAWQNQLTKRLASREISQTRFMQETEWVAAENAAHDLRLEELKRTFVESLCYPGPPQPFPRQDGSLPEPSHWAMPQLTEGLQMQLLARLDSDRKGNP